MSPDYDKLDRNNSIQRSFTAMRNALRSIVFNEGDCQERGEDGKPCECPVCLAKAALAGEEGWRFMGHRPERLNGMPREAAMMAAWRNYFTHTAGRANGTTEPMDEMLSQILFGAESPNEVTERDWYVATTIVQWLATNVGQCVLFDAGYKTDA